MLCVTIDGKEFTEQDIRCWENKRVQVSRKTLEKRLRKSIPVSDADELARFKAELSDNDILHAFRSELLFTKFCTGIVVRLSGNKRKFSITEIDIDFCNAETLHRMYDDMMLNNTPDNRLFCLRANPDHYLLRGIGNNVQEVLEITGGLSVVSLFDICYSDFAGLRSPQEAEYPIQAAGVSYLKNGLAIGAVRHQMKDTEKGCHIKLTVEFPALMPNRNIRAHQHHLACEFFNWFTEFEKRRKERQYE